MALRGKRTRVTDGVYEYGPFDVPGRDEPVTYVVRYAQQGGPYRLDQEVPWGHRWVLARYFGDRTSWAIGDRLDHQDVIALSRTKEEGGPRQEVQNERLERILEAGHAEAVIDEVRGESAIPVGTRTRTRPQEEPVETKVDSRVSDAEVRNLEGHLRETAAVVLQGPPGTGKTRRALQLVEWLANDKRLSGKDPCSSPRVQATQFTRIRDAPEAKTAPVVWEIVQLHPGYAYEDLVRGLAATAGGGFGFEPRDGIVIEMARLASERKGQPTILILDEINRCNLAAALGELILVLEKGYRGLPVRLQYEPPSGRTDEQNFRLPENLWIIGTMNTADRSIAMVDFAIRRRFRFIDVLPDPDVLDEVNTPGAAKRAAREAFERFAALLGGGDDRLAIGHSYFIVQGDEADWAEKLARRLIYEVLPLAREYSQEGLLRRGATADFGPGLRLDPAEPPLRHLAESAVADALRHLGESHDD